MKNLHPIQTQRTEGFENSNLVLENEFLIHENKNLADKIATLEVEN